MPWIDIKLDDIDASDLIDELSERHLDKRDIKHLMEIINDSEYIILDGIERRKLGIIKQIIEKYSIIELQELLNEKIIDTQTLKLWD